MNKYKYQIHNLDCAHCAKRVEDGLNSCEDFHHPIVNFNTSTVSFESEKEFTLKELNNIIQKYDADAYLSYQEEKDNGYHLVPLIMGVAIGLLAYFLPLSETIKLILYIISYSFLLYRTIINAMKLLVRNKSIDEKLLITISCIGALIIGQFLEGMMVIALYTIGKILEGRAVNKGRSSIKGLLELKEPYANIKNEQEIKKVKVEDIQINDLLVVKKGEKIPVDGKIVKGETYLDTSNLTGESTLLQVKEKDNVLSGCINRENVIEIKATTVFSNSTVSKILDLVLEATNKKAKMETLVAKISKFYTPIILLLAVIVILLLPTVFRLSWKDAFYRALTFLVISCPCAIAISVPLSYFAGIASCSKKGILVKGSNYLDNISNAKQIIFDKTGTLTKGSFAISEIEIVDDNYTEKEIMDILRKGESLSNHPIAKSILSLSNEKVDNRDIRHFKEVEGAGIKFDLGDKHIQIGNQELCHCGIERDLHININNHHVASIKISDGIKENALMVIEELKRRHLKTLMFTGDKKDIAKEIGNKLQIDEVKYEMLPQNKFQELEKLLKNNITIFVGDGVNDAPSIKRSDIGISMGSLGSDSTIEASDIVIMNDDLSKIVLTYDISKYTKKIIKQNLVFALSIKFIILLLSILGLTNMWMAVFADTGLTLLTILNSLRILKKY